MPAFYYCEWVHLFWSHVGEWTARIVRKRLVLLDVGYVVDNVGSLWKGEKRVVFLVILPVAWMVICETKKKGLYSDANFSHRDLILFFRYQLRVKIISNGKRLGRITFNRCLLRAASLVLRKGATSESSFTPIPAHGCGGPGFSGLHPG